ncbi:DUF2490 domain-containing protein [Pontibacter sp. 13R65]|uniref:DUF2490 domain-containing protein n=1 Tax=Pontibacter sp. 13R65 TaxID=3127458 RepID=UPI00301BAB89
MRKHSLLLLFLACLAFPSLVSAQEERTRDSDNWNTNLWVGFYNNFRLSEKFFWRAEMHYRRGDYEGQPFIGKMEQIYNRHAITYLFSPTFNMSFGGVLRLNFTPSPGNDAYKEVMHEPRIWHEYLFVMPFPRFQAYHRIRIEHRWSKSNSYEDDWIFRNRWRYKFYAKFPLNKKTLTPGTIYFNPDVEIILQTGKQVIDSPVEDFRVYPSLAYISSPRVTYSAGLMYATGQNLNDGTVYRQRWVMRVSAYISLDFRKDEKKIHSVRLLD